MKTKTKIRLDNVKALEALEAQPQKEPYWQRLGLRGRYVGLYVPAPPGVPSWRARYRAKGGKQRYETLDDATDYASAVTLAQNWFDQIDRGRVTFADPSAGLAMKTPIVEAIARAYIAGKRASKNPKDVDCGDRADGVFAKYLYGGAARGVTYAPHALASFQVRTTERALEDLRLALEDWRKGLTACVAPQSADRIWTSLRAAFNAAMTDRTIKLSRDVARAWLGFKLLGGRGRKRLGRKTAYLSPAERAAFYAVASPELADLLRGIELIGCRPGKEINDTRVADLDLFNQTLRLGDGKIGVRVAPLTAEALEHCRRLARGKTPTDPLFVWRNGLPWTAWRVQDDWKRAKAASGIDKGREHLKPYSFRHSYLTDALTGGEDVGGLDPLTVAELAGTSPEMLREYYFHVQQRPALERLAKIQTRATKAAKAAA